jgi:hypothetical protein
LCENLNKQIVLLNKVYVPDKHYNEITITLIQDNATNVSCNVEVEVAELDGLEPEPDDFRNGIPFCLSNVLQYRLINVLRSLAVLNNGDSDAELREQSSCGVSNFTTWQYGTNRLGIFADSDMMAIQKRRETD